MSFYEVNSVTAMNMKALQIDDPYKDDFYNTVFKMKEEKKERNDRGKLALQRR